MPWRRRFPATARRPWTNAVVTRSPRGRGGIGHVEGSPYVVVVHAPLEILVAESGETSHLAGELERDGLIDCETVQRIACDATIAVAVDDDVGHAIYEGRAKRFPTQAQRREVMRRDRHCRFPGCTNVTFTNVHHIAPWKPGGTTDLPNLALLCKHHHLVVHGNGWTMSGNANEELRFAGPGGRVTTVAPFSALDPDHVQGESIAVRLHVVRLAVATRSVRRGGLMHEGHQFRAGPCRCGRTRPSRRARSTARRPSRSQSAGRPESVRRHRTRRSTGSTARHREPGAVVRDWPRNAGVMATPGAG